jgi:hypothetical protein
MGERYRDGEGVPKNQTVAQEYFAMSADHIVPPAAYDVTQKLRDAVRDNSFTVMADDNTFGDPAPGAIKTLRVEYAIDGAAGMRSAIENKMLTITAASGKTLAIQRAFYGELKDQPNRVADGDFGPAAGVVDVTRKLQLAVRNNTLTITASNASLESDPAPGDAKWLTVDYMVGGIAHAIRIDQGNDLTIPQAGDGTGALVIVRAVWGELK